MRGVSLNCCDLVTLNVTAYPLADAAAAHRMSIEGHPPGKLVLTP